MKAWEITAATDFILAGETFLAAGLLLGRAPSAPSAALYWALSMLCMALAALLGGLDHGFLEPKGDSRPRRILQKTTWMFIGGITFFSLQTAAWQFGSAAWRAGAVGIGLLQLAVFCFFALRTGEYLVVILNYAPVLILLLVLNILGLPGGSGSWQIVAGLSISTAASAVQALGIDRFSPVDRNGLYHLGMMAAVILLWLGGLTLTT
jgi:hypothetical protein